MPLPTSDALALHVARRLTFGPTPELVEEIRRGPMRWIEQQLGPERIDDPEVAAALAGFETLGWSNAQTLAVESETPILLELRHATVLRAVLSRRQLYESMVDFWTNHLNTFVGKGWVGRLKTVEDREVIRAHALGRFADLLVASAKGPAMLEYLDNDSSRRTHPNENYGREVLELHTLGVTGGYTEADIKGVALVLTGWTWDRGTGEFTFRPDWHHEGPVNVLGWSTAGASGPGAVADGEALLGYLARHPSTASFLARKLAERFVSDEPPEDVVASTADAYLKADTDIVATLRHLFGTAAFLAGGSPKLRRPFDQVTCTLRTTGATVDPDPAGPAAGRLDATLLGLGQRLFSCAPPSGYPDALGEWMSTDGLLRRWSWAVQLVRGQLAGVTLDPASFLGDERPADVGSLVDQLAQRLLQEALAESHRAALLGFLNAAADDPVTDAVLADLPTLAGLVLASSEAQWR